MNTQTVLSTRKNQFTQEEIYHIIHQLKEMGLNVLSVQLENQVLVLKIKNKTKEKLEEQR